MKESRELELYEELLLDWMRMATIFFIAGIALYHFTTKGKPYTLIAFGLSITLIITMVIDSIIRRKDLKQRGLHPRLALDIIILVMIIALLLVIWIAYGMTVEPSQNGLPGDPSIEALELSRD